MKQHLFSPSDLNKDREGNKRPHDRASKFEKVKTTN